MRHHCPPSGAGTGASWSAALLSALACVVIFALACLACPAAAQPAPASGAVEGVVVRARDATPVVGAEVTVPGGGASAVTNALGAFSLRGVEAGLHALEVRRAGFVPQTLERVEVRSGEVTRLRVELEPVSFSAEIEVAPSRYSLYGDRPAPRLSTSREELRRIPHLADDAFRALERLPGMASEEVSAQVNIRGGEVNETLVLVDGLEVYDGFHLQDMGSIFSIVDSEALGGLDAMTGGFPVEYGNRMSGVVDMTSATSDVSETALVAGFTQLGVLSEGSFEGGRGGFLVSARRTYLDQVIETIDPDSGFKPVFYDLLASLRFSLGSHSVLSANVLGAADDLAYEETNRDGDVTEEQLDADSHSAYAWLNLKTVWSPRVSSQTVLSHGQVRRRREGWIDYWVAAGEVDEERRYDVTGLRQDWTFDASRRHTLRGGLDLRRAAADYDYVSSSIVRDPLFVGATPEVTERDIQLEPSGSLYGVWVADRFRLAEPLTAEVGVRWDRQTYVDDDDQLSPRVNLAWALGERSVLRAAWGLYHQPQYPHELQVQDGVTEFAPAQRAEHRLLGFETAPGTGWSLRLEAYQKLLEDLRPRFENQINPIEVFPEIEPDRILVDPERAEAWGVELMVKRQGRGAWSWWASYAYSKAEDLVDGAWVPRSWDQPHAVSFAVNFAPGRAWNFNLAGIYHTGWPTSAILAELVTLPDGSLGVDLSLGPRNQERYDDYLRFDLRASRSFRVGDGSLRLFLEVLNLLDRENLARVESIALYLDSEGNLQVTEEREQYLPILPTFGVRWTF